MQLLLLNNSFYCQIATGSLNSNENKDALYSRKPKMETADLSQSHASLNLSQFRVNFFCL